MAHAAIDYPVSAAHRAGLPIINWFRLMLRHWRRERARRRRLEQVRKTVCRPRLLADVGVAPASAGPFETLPPVLMVIHH